MEATASEIFHHLQHDWNFGGIKLDGNQVTAQTMVVEPDEQPMTSNYGNILHAPELSAGINNAVSTGSIATEIVQDDSHTAGGDCILQNAVADLIDDNSIEDANDEAGAEADEDEEDLDDNDAVRDIVDELQQQHEQIMQLQQQQQRQHQLQQIEMVEHFQQQEHHHQQQQLQQQHQQQQQQIDHHIANHHHAQLNEYAGEVSYGTWTTSSQDNLEVRNVNIQRYNSSRLQTFNVFMYLKLAA